MNDPIKALKQQAWDLKRAGAPGTLRQLQELLAHKQGFRTYAAFRAAHKKEA